MRRRGSIISGVLIASCVFAVLIGVAATAGYLGVRRQNATATRLAGQSTVLQEADGKLGEDLSRARFAVLTSALSGDGRYLAPVEPARADYRDRLSVLQRRAPPALRGLVATEARAGSQWWALVPRLTALRAGSPQGRSLLARSSALAGTFLAANVRLQERLHDRVLAQAAAGCGALTAGLTWAGAALGVALVLVLAVSIGIWRAVTRPLRDLAVTVRRLTAGDRASRAPVAGSAEVCEVARAVNTQADEADRLRSQEQESSRLRSRARAAGIQIREHLSEADVLDEARRALAATVPADRVHLYVIRDSRLEPVGEEVPHDWAAPESLVPSISPEDVASLRERFRAQRSQLFQEPPAAGQAPLPPQVQAYLRRAGVASGLLTPFGVRGQPLGMTVLLRLRPGSPWRPAEVDAAESIAADLGRGLNHARIYEAENRLVEELQGLDRAKSDFFATVSHELRAPLTSIEGYIEMIGDGDAGPVTEEQRQMLGTAERSAARLRNLIEDVFTLSKLESGAFGARLEPVNVGDVVAGAVAAIGPSVSAGGLTLSAALPGGALMVQGDAGQLDRVFINLLSNAVKFTPEGGRVEVSAAAQGQWAAVRVADTGIGIPAADQGKLFSRFFRASNATQRGIPGTGLGLAIVRTVVGAHHGELDLQSEADRGTAVTVRLPLTPGQGPPAAAGAAAGQASSGDSLSLRHLPQSDHDIR